MRAGRPRGDRLDGRDGPLDHQRTGRAAEDASRHCVRPFVQMVQDPAFVAACDKRHLMLSSGERSSQS